MDSIHDFIMDTSALAEEEENDNKESSINDIQEASEMCDIEDR